MLLVTADPGLHDEVALLAVVIGARLQTHSDWDVASTSPSASGWAAVLCGPDAPPPTSWRGEVLLVVPDPGSESSGEAADPWVLAAGHPQLRPVPLPEGEPWLAEHLGSRVMDRMPGRVLAVLGALGGVGASTVAYLAAAEASARGLRVLLLDADPHAGSGLRTLREQARSLGRTSSEAAALDWEELTRIEGTLSAAQLTGALEEVDGIPMITGEAVESEEVPASLGSVVSAGRRAVDLVVIDCGRRASVLGCLTGTPEAGLIVTEPSPRGAAAVAEIPLEGHAVDWSLVVNRASRSAWSSAEIARRLGLPVTAELAEQRWLTRSAELGEAYEMLRTRRGATFAANLLHAAGLDAGGRIGG